MAGTGRRTDGTQVRKLRPTPWAYVDRLHDEQANLLSRMLDHIHSGVCEYVGGDHAEQCPEWSELLTGLIASENRILILYVRVGVELENALA